MRQWQKMTGFLIIVSAALSTLLATSPEPPAVDLAVITSATPAMNYYYGVVPQAFVCQGQEAIILWELHNSSSARLNADPSDNTEPVLKDIMIDQKGQRRIRVLDDVTIRLTEDRDYQTQVQLLPDSLCQPINLTGTFAGTLEQAEPSPASLARTLNIAATDLGLTGTLLTVAEYPEASYFDCSYQADEISCQRHSFVEDETGEVNFSLSGIMTATGFSGSYQGFDESPEARIPFSGSFSFERQELAIPE